MQRLKLTHTCFNHIQAMARRMQPMLCDYDGRPQVDLAVLVSSIAARAMDDEGSLISMGLSLKQAASERESRQEAFVVAYFQHVLDLRRTLGDRLSPLHGKEMNAELAQRMFGRPVECPQEARPQGSIAAALAMLEWNAQTALDCVATLFFLAGLASYPSTTSRAKSLTALDACVDAARAHLFSAVERFQSRLLKLALVQGDLRRLEQLRQRVHRQSFGPGISVMENFEVACILPSSTEVAVEERFRGELNAAMIRPIDGAS